MKKAYIVKFEIRTRVESENPEQAIEQAIEKVLANADQYVINDNACWPEEDLEMPTEEQKNEIADAYKYIEETTREHKDIQFEEEVIYECGPDAYYGYRNYSYRRAFIDGVGRVILEYEYDNGHDKDTMKDELRTEVPQSVIVEIAEEIRMTIEDSE